MLISESKLRKIIKEEFESLQKEAGVVESPVQKIYAKLGAQTPQDLANKLKFGSETARLYLKVRGAGYDFFKTSNGLSTEEADQILNFIVANKVEPSMGALAPASVRKGVDKLVRTKGVIPR